MIKRFIPILCLVLTVVATHALGRGSPEAPLETVPHVDLPRYLGKWYEIARYENSFQRDCYGTTATYSLREDGDIRVVNRCFMGSLEGEVDEAIGRAWVTDAETNAKLKVRFFWPFSGRYWIIDLGDDYEFAVVGEPSRKYLWILARTPHLAPEVYAEILNRLIQSGYDPKRLLVTEHKKHP